MKKFLCLLLTSSLFVACSNIYKSEVTSSSVSESNLEVAKLWLSDGYISIARPVPAVALASRSDNSSLSVLGFMPTPNAARVGTWIKVDRQTNSVSLMNGEKEVSVSKGEGINDLQPGQYQVLHKQRNPLWYAPDEYFKSRNIKVPPQGDKSRFLRGALGDFAMFINKDTPIYSGPLWSTEIGGVRLEEDEMSRLYYEISVGSFIEVK